MLLTKRGSNDEQQSEAMDINHHMLTMCADNKIYFAPLEKGKVQVRRLRLRQHSKTPLLNSHQKVLDVGTGTGLWAMYVCIFLEYVEPRSYAHNTTST